MLQVFQKNMFLSSDPDELCNRIKWLLQERQVGNNSNKNNNEFFAIVDNLLEDKRMSKKEHKQIFHKM